MHDIAAAAGISRQAIYLHFATRAELLIGTTQYVDEVKGLAERLQPLWETQSGVALLADSVAAWGKYIPEVYGLAKALLRARATDDAAQAAWKTTVDCLRELCSRIVATLRAERRLRSGWTEQDAIDMLLAVLSITNWEQLTVEFGWSQAAYIEHMQVLLRRTFVREDDNTTDS